MPGPGQRRGRSKSTGRGGKTRGSVAPLTPISTDQNEELTTAEDEAILSPVSPGGTRRPANNPPLYRRIWNGIFGNPDATKSLHKNEEQVKEAATKGTLHNTILSGTIEEARELIRKDPTLLTRRGPVGELPFHFCFLLGKVEMGFELLQMKPQLVAEVYEGQGDEPSAYEGENILHIAIVNKMPITDIERMIRIHNGKKLFLGTVTGSFFRDPFRKFKDSREELEGKCYLGEYPLAFAIATNQFETFDALVRLGADINCRDSFGNNILHVLVILQNKEGYAYYKQKWLEKYYPGKKAEDLKYDDDGRINEDGRIVPWKQRNHENMTPFTLAAYRGLYDIFKYLVEEGKVDQWTYGAVTCSVYPLDNGLDNISSSTGASALELIILRGHLKFFENKRINDLFERKWVHFGERKVKHQLLLETFQLVCLAGFVFLRKNFVEGEPGIPSVGDKECASAESNATSNSSQVAAMTPSPWEFFLYYALLAIVVGGAALHFKTEVRKLFDSRGLASFIQQPTVSFLKSISFMLYFLGLSCFVYLHFFSQCIWCEQLVLGLTCPIAWSSIFFYLLAWKSTGTLVIMIGEMLVKDVLRFLSVYVVFLVGFSQAFFVLDNNQKGLLGLRFGLLTLFEATLGDFELGDAKKEGLTSSTFLSLALIVMFVVIVAVLMINLLIAMMGSTYELIEENALLRWRMERARIISRIEQEMSENERQDDPNKYYVELQDKRFLQVYDKEGEDGEVEQ